MVKPAIKYGQRGVKQGKIYYNAVSYTHLDVYKRQRLQY